MKNYLKRLSFITILTFTIVYLSANYLQIDIRSPFVEVRSPIVITVMYDKHLEPKENSMDDLANGQPIEVEEVTPMAFDESSGGF